MTVINGGTDLLADPPGAVSLCHQVEYKIGPGYIVCSKCNLPCSIYVPEATQSGGKDE